MTLIQRLNTRAVVAGESVRYPRYIKGVGQEVLDYFKPFANDILEHADEVDTGRPVVFVTVCSQGKPYRTSYIHYHINKALFEAGLLSQVERWHLSSAGMIPASLEEELPFCAYDWNNEEASIQDRQDLRDALGDYFAAWRDEYALPRKTAVVSYFRESSNTQRTLNLCTCPAGLVWKSVKAASVWSSASAEKQVTLHGFYKDPDNYLLDIENLKQLVVALRRQVNAHV